MKLIKMTVPHNPPLSYGNCHQCALAMMLDFELDWVPHFCDGNRYGDDWEKHQRDWLLGLGRRLITFPLDGGASLELVLASRESFNAGVPYILGCTTENGNHSVVVEAGQVLNPGNSPVVGPMTDGYWYASYLGVV